MDVLKQYTLTQARAVCALPNKHPHPSSMDSYNIESWDEGLGWSGAKAALLTGVKRKRLASIANRISTHLKYRHAELETDVLSHGRGRIDMKRYVAGNPKFLWGRADRDVLSPTLRIGVSISAPFYVNAQAWEQRGAALLALVEIAERRNIRTSIEVVSSVNNPFVSRKCNDLDISVQIKKEGASLSKGIANFTLAHAGFMRRIIFRLMEEAALEHDDKVEGGYGTVNFDKPEWSDYDLWIPTWKKVLSADDLIKTVVEWTSIVNSKQEEHV